MGIVDRINEAVLRRMRPPAMDRQAGRIASSVEKITRLVALRSSEYVGDTMMLIAQLDDGSRLYATEHDVDWADLLTALDRSGRSLSSSAIWTLQLIGDPSHAPIALIDSPSEPSL